MRMSCGLLVVCAIVLSPAPGRAQDLVPGAYTPAPAGVTILTLGASSNVGDLSFDPSLAITDGHATIGGAAVGVNHTFRLAGRSASAGFALPFVHGHLEGRLGGLPQEASRSGLGDAPVRIAVNLYGAPAMTLQEFAAYRGRTILGVSLTMGVPVGEYFPDKFINIGTNRWVFKPELGFSRKRGKWTFEGDAAVSFYTDNTNFVGAVTREQSPIMSAQGHLIHTFRPALWIAADGNFWRGGRITTNGGTPQQQQKNSRLGITLAVPIRRQQLRIAYSFGAYTTIGGDFQSVGVSYSYAWLPSPSK